MKRLRYITLVFSLILLAQALQSQTEALDKLSSEAYTEEIKENLSESVPFISIKDYQDNSDDYVLLDAREKNEYDVSHIPNALRIGYSRPDFKMLKNIPKDKPLVIYCSIGYRSEKIGEKLIKKGYQVYNLYGSIFEWANRNLELHDSKGEMTQSIHGYNKSWSRWIEHPALDVTY